MIKKLTFITFKNVSTEPKNEAQILERFILATFRVTVNPIKAGGSESMHCLKKGRRE